MRIGGGSQEGGAARTADNNRTGKVEYPVGKQISKERGGGDAVSDQKEMIVITEERW